MNVALLVLRVIVGGLFVGHGSQKLFGWFGGHGRQGTAGRPSHAPLVRRAARHCRRERRAMSSASSSMEMPALTRRTLDWLSTSLLKGMSREALSVIFRTAVAMSMFSATGGREPLSRPPTRHGPPSPSSHSSCFTAVTRSTILKTSAPAARRRCRTAPIGQGTLRAQVRRQVRPP